MITEKQRIALIAAELKKRKPKQFDLKRFCFPEQLAFIQDSASFKTAVCSRRAGKTVGCAADLIHTALNHSGVVSLYITLSRINAKRIIWPEILRINREYALGGKPNDTELSIRFPNSSVIYASGAKDKSEIENFRGLPIKKAYVDECQSFRPYIEDLIDDVLSKALFDYSGTLCLTGTPGAVPAGYFHNCAQSQEWSHHAWTMLQNPWLQRKSGKTAMELILADCKRMGVDLSHPKIQRECFGKWVIDPDALVFKYDPKKNDYEALPELAGKWQHVIGVDLGFDDSDAIAVIGWSTKLKEAYLVDEIVRPKQGITELANQIDSLYRKYDPLRIVMDTGGLGKKISEEIQRRYSLPIQAAEKTRKFEYIEILNDALRTQKFYANKTSHFANDCFLVEWDKESLQPKISDNYHSDITDAVLYAFRESLHWLYEPEKFIPKRNTPEWFAQAERDMEEALEARLRSLQDEDLLSGF